MSRPAGFQASGSLIGEISKQHKHQLSDGTLSQWAAYSKYLQGDWDEAGEHSHPGDQATKKSDRQPPAQRASNDSEGSCGDNSADQDKDDCRTAILRLPCPDRRAFERRNQCDSPGEHCPCQKQSVNIEWSLCHTLHPIRRHRKKPGWDERDRRSVAF
jgi:hypothetical protein